MSKLVVCGFNPLVQEDVIFLRNLVVSEAGDAEKTVAMFAKWKSGYNAKWQFTQTTMASDLECIRAEGVSGWDRTAHIIALFAIFGASAIGVFLPIVGQTIRGLNQMSIPVFPIQLGQFFGAGIIIATAFLHLLPAANDALTNTCLAGFADRYGAWACVIALAAVMSMHSIEWWLMEAWVGRSAHSNFQHTDTNADHGPRKSHSSSELFPAYSRAYNASRMILPPPALSPPVNPVVFGASPLESRLTGFALTKHGNYAAVMHSRQHLAMVQNDRMSRYLYSDPQFPLYAPSSVWPMQLIGAAPSAAIAMRGAAQAKSTPELMHKTTNSLHVSRNSTSMASSARNTQSSRAVSLRPDSFSNMAKFKRQQNRQQKRRSQQQETATWKQRCLSMPRLPPTTLEAGLCDSLLEPLPPLPDSTAESTYSSKLQQPRSTSTSFYKRVSSRSARPISTTMSTSGKRQSKRTSLQAVAALAAAAKRSSAGPSDTTTSPSSARLGTVHETEDKWAIQSPTSQPRRSSDDMSAGQVFASATSAMPRPSESAAASQQPTFHTPRSHKRVSIPSPHVIRAAPSSCAFRSISTEQRPSANYTRESGFQQSGYPRAYVDARSRGLLHHNANAAANPITSIYANHNGQYPIENSHGTSDSTTAHSRNMSASSILTFPAEVKQRALATYILELGIAMYSVLIGLALAISDSGFIAMFIAICFHQFFEGMALGTSLAELYWIKAQLAQHQDQYSEHPEIEASAEIPAAAHESDESPRHETITSVRSGNHSVINMVPTNTAMPITTPDGRPSQIRSSESADIYSDEFDYVIPDNVNRQSHARRTVTSMATSFTPEPWLVNPQLEKTIVDRSKVSLGQRGASTTQPPDVAAAIAKEEAIMETEKSAAKNRKQLPRYLLPRNQPERLPGWWKAWVSALAFCITTPTGIIIGLALHNIYEPHSQYALLLNGVLQSICTGVLIYAGLVTLIIGGFSSSAVKQLPRLMQLLLFVAVYAGAAVMAGLKVWK
ncbi:hypothetical protein LPJ79_005764 [Coemansia sp. RSA 1821]|nr:hypothetical protein LPJ79_005764 [Coemansia sp. RSA 1821]